MSAEDPTERPEGAAGDPGAADADPFAQGAAGSGGVPAATTRRRRVALWWAGAQDVEPTPRERARRRAMRRAAVATLVVMVGASLVRLPLLVTSPGPTFNTIGEIDGTAMITITGTTTYPTQGALDMTTVSERGGASGGVYLGEALAGWLAPRASVIPRETYYPPDVTGEQVTERNDQLFATSQSDAVAAAMRQLKIPTEDAVVVTVVGGGTPADGIVQAGDVIVAVDGTEVDDPGQVVDLVRASTVGQTIELDVLRTGADGSRSPAQLEVVTAAGPGSPDQGADAAPVPVLGIVVGTLYEAPFDIDFASSQVGGPSAGLMFSLAIVDMLTPGPLTGGGHVAGTGTIDPAGAVGPIGGIDKKLPGARNAGATLFLAPQGNCAEVVGHVPDGLTVVPVGTLDTAVATVQAWAEDPATSFPTCEQVLDQAAADPASSG